MRQAVRLFGIGRLAGSGQSLCRVPDCGDKHRMPPLLSLRAGQRKLRFVTRCDGDCALAPGLGPGVALLLTLERIPIMLQYILHERRIWRHFGGQPSHELTDAAAKRIPETESPAKTPPFRTPWKSRFNPNGNRSNA